MFESFKCVESVSYYVRCLLSRVKSCGFESTGMQISAPRNSTSCHATHCRSFSALFFTFHDCIVWEYSG